MTESDKFYVAHALAEAAKSMAVRGNPDDTLHAIVVAARAAVPGFNEVSATAVAAEGAITTIASTNSVVQDLDSLQHKLGEGPSLTACHNQELVLVQRWNRTSGGPRTPLERRTRACAHGWRRTSLPTTSSLAV